MKRPTMIVAKSVGLVCVATLAFGAMGCRGQTSKDAPIFGIRNMYDQPRYNEQSESEYFEDKRTMRPIPEGAVSRERNPDLTITSGRNEENTGYVMTVPKSVVDGYGGMDKTLERGRERFGIYCTPCHDATGSGQGMVKKRAVAGGAAAFVPPTFHQDRIRHMPDGQLYATIANGKNNMPPYPQIQVNDRWAIVAYVRALQLSQAKVPQEPTL
jgi:mono/diheme cytochrome c family protein